VRALANLAKATHRAVARALVTDRRDHLRVDDKRSCTGELPVADDEQLPVADDDERDPGEPSGPADADQTAIMVLGPLGAGDKNLDLQPPTHATTDADNDLYITLPTPATLYALGNAYIAAWQEPGTLPTAADCVSTIESASADEVPLATGTVVCARTGEGRIARLTGTATPGNGLATTKFDAIVWQAA
jgi:hypothetical protein